MLGKAFAGPEKQMINDFQNCRSISILEVLVADIIYQVSLLHDPSQFVKIAFYLADSMICTWCTNSRGSIDQNWCFISATAQRQFFDPNLIGLESYFAPFLFWFSLTVG